MGRMHSSICCPAMHQLRGMHRCGKGGGVRVDPSRRPTRMLDVGGNSDCKRATESLAPGPSQGAAITMRRTRPALHASAWTRSWRIRWAELCPRGLCGFATVTSAPVVRSPMGRYRTSNVRAVRSVFDCQPGERRRNTKQDRTLLPVRLLRPSVRDPILSSRSGAFARVCAASGAPRGLCVHKQQEPAAPPSPDYLPTPSED